MKKNNKEISAALWSSIKSSAMANLYTKDSKSSEKSPNKETVRFLLDYSRSLKITTYKNLKFEVVVN